MRRHPVSLLAVAALLVAPGLTTAQVPEEPLHVQRTASTVPPELWHATASSIWAPGERCFDPAEAVCTVRVERVMAGGPSNLFAPPNPGAEQLGSPPRGQTAAQAHDRELAQRVDRALLTPGDQVDVQVSEGRVTLVGKARSAVERRMMVIRAMGVAGAQNVANQIEVPR